VAASSAGDPLAPSAPPTTQATASVRDGGQMADRPAAIRNARDHDLG
jgi:hypothetical protein